MNGQYRECPFCDKDGFQEVEEATFKTHTEYRVACANCGAHGPNEISVEQAIKMWNLRRPFDTLNAQVQNLRNQDATMLESYRKLHDKYTEVGRLLAYWFDSKIDIGSIVAAAIKFSSTPESEW